MDDELRRLQDAYYAGMPRWKVWWEKLRYWIYNKTRSDDGFD